MSNKNSTIGFGSLFLPTSVMRVDDSVGPAKPKYKEGRRHGDRNILRRNAVESWAWEERNESKEILPVKVDGLRRDYNLESSYGGTMLDVEEDSNSWINAVVISGLTNEEKEKLDSSESAYDLEVVEREDIEPYVSSHSEDLDEIFDSNEVEIYIGESEPTQRQRNNTYHDRIRTGIDFLDEMHGEEVAEEVWQDFKKTTYETSVSGISPQEGDKTSYSDWRNWSNTVEENNRALEGFSELMD